MEACDAPISLELRQAARRRLIRHRAGFLHRSPPVPPGSMVIPRLRRGIGAAGVEQRGEGPFRRGEDVEMGGKPAPGVVAKDVARHGHDLDPVSIEHRDAEVGERQDAVQQRQVDSTS